MSAEQADATVRGVEASERSMTPIFLNLGRSTVLRFRDKPRKVVLGNRNYFNIEFIENDLAIQPLGVITTNLFVYGETHTYGFTMKSSVGQGADDLVHVVWAKPSELKEMLKSREVQRKEIKKTFVVGKLLRVRVDVSALLKSKGLKWVEIRLESLEKKPPSISKVDVRLIEAGKEISSSLVCDGSELLFEQNLSCRVFYKSDSLQSKRMKVKIGNSTGEAVF